MMLNEWFYYLIDLHYSQTHRLQDTEREKFYYLIDLHYSQTWWYTKRELNKFYYLIDLHYSQTLFRSVFLIFSVLLPYRFTLFSNSVKISAFEIEVLLPYRFTLFSNTFTTTLKPSISFTTL